MSLKEEIAKDIVGRMSEGQKCALLIAFHEKNKSSPNIDILMDNMKKMLGYTKDDWKR